MSTNNIHLTIDKISAFNITIPVSILCVTLDMGPGDNDGEMDEEDDSSLRDPADSGVATENIIILVILPFSRMTHLHTPSLWFFF
jgi:hypothetical protein